MNRLIGKTVIHKDFGEGVITKAEEAKNDTFVDVRFPNGTSKRLSLNFVLTKGLSPDSDEITAILDDIAKAKEEASRMAKLKNMDKELLAEIEKSKKTAEEGDRVIAFTDRKTLFGNETNRIFKVHQGQTFTEECHGNYIWAPSSGLHHHERMTEIHPGDIVFHYANGALVAVSEALSGCFNYPRPSELSGHGWGHVGYRVELRYEVLNQPFSLFPYRADIIANRAHRYSSFDSNGDACQGYLYELENVLAKLFATELLKGNQPSGVIRVLNRI